MLREFPWSWTDLQATPSGVRQMCWDLLMIERSVAAERAERQQRAVGDEPGTIRIPR